MPANHSEEMQQLLNKVAVRDDLSHLSEPEKQLYYQHICDEYGLNAAAKPFSYITFEDERTILYANKNATDQLRQIHGVSVTLTEHKSFNDDVYMVLAKGRTKDGREDESIGAVALKDWEGELFTPGNLAKAIMSAETKAKRRVTLALCGLSLLDELEVHDMKKNRGPQTQKNSSIENDNKSQDTEPLEKKKEEKPKKVKDPITVEWSNYHRVDITAIEQLMGSSDEPYWKVSAKKESGEVVALFAVNLLAQQIQQIKEDKDIGSHKYLVTARNTSKGLLLTSIQKEKTITA